MIKPARYNMFSLALLWGLLTFLGYSTIELKAEGKPPMVIVIPSYNNTRWYEPNLSSVLHQSYKNYRVIYLNDCSKDGTGAVVEQFLKSRNVDFCKVEFDVDPDESIPETTKRFSELVNRDRHFFILVNNTKRCGALANLYRSIQSCDDNEIIVTVDGDDWLSDKKVLTDLYKTYSGNNVWLTHGKLKEYPSGIVGWSEPIPRDIVKRGTFRKFRCPSHLRTFYAWLFKKIRLEDLLYDGDFFSMTWDMAIMYPMIEMAGERHAFMKRVNYIYNQANEISDNKVDPQLQRDLDDYIRNMPKYERLERRGEK